jgi:hypothetical protein
MGYKLESLNINKKLPNQKTKKNKNRSKKQGQKSSGRTMKKDVKKKRSKNFLLHLISHLLQENPSSS